MRIVIIFALIALAFAEPPAPYPPRGWKPSGLAFTLPTEQKQATQYLPPTSQYGLPDPQYGPPQQEYGPPIKQELPKPVQEKPFQEYGPVPSIQPSVSWQIPEEQLKFIPSKPSTWEQYGPPKDEQTEQPMEVTTEQVTDEEEELRVLEQIRQYRLNQQKQKFRQQQSASQKLPINYDVLKRLKGNRPRPGRLQAQQEPQPEVQENEDQGYDNGYAPNQDVPQVQPRRKYGVPSATTKNPVAAPRTTTTLPETTTEAQDNEPSEGSGEENLGEDGPNIAISNAVARQGQYYIVQPNGKLQRVTYRTAENPKNKNSPIVSNLRYEEVNPIKDPIYSYVNGQLVRIN